MGVLALEFIILPAVLLSEARLAEFSAGGVRPNLRDDAGDFAPI
jgi:hypothetical protein